MTPKGYVDLQVNGCLGVDFSSPLLTSADCRRAIAHVINSGTEVLLPTLISAPPEVYRRNIAVIMEAVAANNWQDNVPGVHLEGPFISPLPGAVGCHDPQMVRRADATLLDLPFLKMVTVAADSEGICEFIAEAAKRGIAVSLGHHMADGRQLAAAAAAGAAALTHLGNGLPGMLDRHRNPVWAGLACDGLSAMLIADRHHLPPEVLKCMIRCKGVDKIIITSDASPGAGLPPGRYRLLGNDAVLEPGGRLHNPEKQCLVGSSAMLGDCCEFLRGMGLWSEDELDMMCRRNALALLEPCQL